MRIAIHGWAGEQFSVHGLAAYALDLRGRGRSDGERFYIEKFSDYTGDVGQLVEIARAENPVCRSTFSVTAPAALFPVPMFSKIRTRSPD
jgi:alpha-beta hydrolase superfamily lysophospholipase